MNSLDRHWLMWDAIIKIANEEELKLHRYNYITYLKRKVLGDIVDTIIQNCHLCEEYMNNEDYNCYKCPLYLLQGDTCSDDKAPFTKIHNVKTIKSFIKYATIIRDCVSKPGEEFMTQEQKKDFLKWCDSVGTDICPFYYKIMRTHKISLEKFLNSEKLFEKYNKGKEWHDYCKCCKKITGYSVEENGECPCEYFSRNVTENMVRKFIAKQ